jgi:hypothetical protein
VGSVTGGGWGTVVQTRGARSRRVEEQPRQLSRAHGSVRRTAERWRRTVLSVAEERLNRKKSRWQIHLWKCTLDPRGATPPSVRALFRTGPMTGGAAFPDWVERITWSTSPGVSRRRGPTHSWEPEHHLGRNMRKTGWMGSVSSSGCFESTTGAIENLWWSIAVRRLIWTELILPRKHYIERAP